MNPRRASGPAVSQQSSSSGEAVLPRGCVPAPGVEVSLEKVPPSPTWRCMVTCLLESAAARLQNGLTVIVLGCWMPLDAVRRRRDCGPPGRLPVLSARDGPPEPTNLENWFQILFQNLLELHQHSHFLANQLACCLLPCEDSILLSPHLLLAEVQGFSVSARAAAGLPDPVWSDIIVSHREVNSCADGCHPEFPWKRHPGW